MSRRLVVEADGGSRGNPGPAGYGAVVRDADTGEVLAERAAGIGRATNNVAEYRGLVAGLAAAAELEPASVEVLMDSKLVIEQMSGRWRVRHPDLAPLHAEAARLARRLPAVRYGWIPRERNAYADRLANEAMDAAAVGRDWAPSGPARTADADPEAERQPVASPWRSSGEPRTTLLLVRHGETVLSGKRFSGRGDPMLSERGTAQAAAVASRLSKVDGVAAVVSSPLRRARATADAIAAGLGLVVTVDADLVEGDFGRWDGLTFAEVKEGWPTEHAAWLADPAAAPPGGESVNQVARRARRARDRILAAYPGRTVVVVSHVTPIKLLLCSALGAPASAVFRIQLDTAGLSEATWYAEGPALVRLVNDTGHLR
ncbi:MAG TPA: bifunctional RNase H/acid phosphatase [Mycobacteriales bacterium]|nr:bifunctional RNase H/acid phosphatase [Mycobacteriales bacterium]